MKLTLNVDEELLTQAQDIAGGKSKTATIDLALRDFVR
ncbi:MAG: type II toxin-antitoxin system VapB family antitoxin, partial [Verrucomicrobia bacterium]|nr:type II toxin-antitoxin system VapB family antitoxin [Verrucomicrobiota bacterium]